MIVNLKYAFGWLVALCILAMLVLGLLALIARVPVVEASEPEELSLSLKAGETYVINDLKQGSTPSVKVLSNPHAMFTNAEEPGKLVVIGAETGRWAITVTRADGTNAIYDVAVSGLANFNNPLKPGESPPAIGDGESASAAASGPVVTPQSNPKPAPSSTASSETESPPGDYSAPSAPEPSAPPMAATPPVQPAATYVRPVSTVIPHQEVGPLESRNGQFLNNPSVLTNGGYTTDSISGGRHYLPPDAIAVMAGMSRVIDFQNRLTRVSIADSRIADVQVVNPFQLNLIAHTPGFTTLATWDDHGSYDERQVRIDPNGRQQVMLNCIVAELDKTNLENQGMNYSVALTNYGVSLVGLPGAVATPYTQQSSSSGGNAPSTVLPLGGSIVPLLLSSNLTYGLAAQNSNVLTQTLFQYLEQHNLGKVLAEPHLLANSGERAKFLSGGEIPIVVAQALNTSIVFKQFGTSVEFVPTVVGSNDIQLLVKPEVSQPDYAHGVDLFGFNVPAFVTRRAETLVQLKDNQTLIIAGLILHQKVQQIIKVPYLGDIPYAGGLFRNTYWQDQETDLVMSVTPQIVSPLPSGAEVFIAANRLPLSPREIRTRTLTPPDASRPRF